MADDKICAVCGGSPRFRIENNPCNLKDMYGENGEEFKLYSCDCMQCFEAVLYCTTVATGLCPVVSFESSSHEEHSP
jgi:hypothetical protein